MSMFPPSDRPSSIPRLVSCFIAIGLALSLLSCAGRQATTPETAYEIPDPGMTVTSEATDKPQSMPLSALSGRWTGTDTLIVAGTCMLSVGPEPTNEITNPVNMLWEVEETGETTVQIATWPGAFPYTFNGSIDPNLNVYLALSTTAGCGGDTHDYTANYEGVIETNGHRAEVVLQATEVWCPGSCIFERVYSLHIAESLP